MARDRGAGELQLADDRGNGRVKLHLAVELQLRRELLGDDGGVVAERDRAALAGALGGEAQHGNLRVDAEGLGGLGGLDGDLGQLLRSRERDLTGGLVDVVLIVDVDGAVAHGEHLVAADHDEAGAHEVGALLGLDELQRRTDGVRGGVGRAAEQGVGHAHLHEHGAEVVALLEVGADFFHGHFALAQVKHALSHLVHLVVVGGIDDLETLDVEVAGLGRRLHVIDIADKDRRQEAALLQAGSGLEDAGVGALGVNDLARIGFENFNQIFEHGVFLQYISIFCLL